ncbi:MAG: PstS family phosphate ABC transporter substrate-binding protein [Melioribacteraceae bacterium]|nr:PstS family phosphate ABC transporter substrate-binding protein [Melioribacteraceae bacterium]
MTYYNRILFLLFLMFYSCKVENLSPRDIITIKGSDTMVNLTLRWAESYMKINPEVSIQVTGGGSGNGIAALLNNTAHIANISRELKDVEIKRAAEFGVNPVQHKVALDGIAIIVNPENSVDSLSLIQLKNIFSGEIQNWNELGGEPGKIVLYGRENSSGTYEFFKQNVLNTDSSGSVKEFSTGMQVLQGTAALAEAVSRDRRGIGFGGIGYFALRDDVKIVSVKVDPQHKAFNPVLKHQPDYEIVRERTYPLSRYLYIYTNGTPSGKVEKFIKFIQSEVGQKIVKEMEYIPLEQSYYDNE